MPPKKKTCMAGHVLEVTKCEKCNLHCCAITPERGAEIRAQARSGTNWAEVVGARPVCVCGMSKTMICPIHG